MQDYRTDPRRNKGAYLEKTAQIYIHIKVGAERPSDNLGRPIVAMVQTAQAIMGKDATRGTATADWSCPAGATFSGRSPRKSVATF